MAKKKAKKSTKTNKKATTKKNNVSRTPKAHASAETKPAKKESKTKKILKDPAVWIIAILIIIAVVVAVIANNKDTGSSTSGTVTLVEYTDYGCPFCAKAHKTIKTLEEEYGSSLKVIHKNFPIKSLHPTSPKAHEAAECAKDQNKFTEYRDWLFLNQDQHEINDLKKAASDLGLDLEQFNLCLDSGEKTSIVTNDLNEAIAKGLTGTPSFYVDGKLLKGAQPISAFRSAIDKALNSNGTVNEEPVDIILFTDSRCTDCDDLTYAKSALEQQITDGKYTFVDYNTEEGKALYEKYNLSYLPALLFSKGFENTEIYAKVESSLMDVGDYYYVPIQAHDPTAEICDNEIDDTGNGLIDCDDLTCADTLSCREEIENNVKLYIMSDCPYGKKAVEALKPINNLFQDQLTYEIHYIATENPDGTVRSLHGQSEVDEDVIQLCVEKIAPEKHLNYLYCRSTGTIKGTDWKDCATTTGIDIDAVQSCFDNEGLDLLKEDIKEAQELGVSGSPTWLINNKYQTGGFDSEAIKTFICSHNNLTGCDTELDSDNSGVTGSC